MPEGVLEVDEFTLNEHWRATGSHDPNLVRSASEVLRNRPEDRIDVDAVATAIRRG